MLANNILLNNIFFLNTFQYLNINRQRLHPYLSSKSLMTLKTLCGNTIFNENFTNFSHFYETYWCQWDFFRRIIKSNDHIIFKWFNESNDIWINGTVFLSSFAYNNAAYSSLELTFRNLRNWYCHRMNITVGLLISQG